MVSRLSKIVPEFKIAICLALPLIATEIIYTSNNFLATVMVSRLGVKQLAASALVWNIYTVLTIFFIGIFSAVGVMIAQHFGFQSKKNISICFKLGLILAVIFTLPMTFILFFSPKFLIWTNQDPAVIKVAEPFFKSLAWTMLPLNIWIIIQQFFIGITKTKIVGLMSIFLMPLELFFYYGFIFGKFGLPELGISGIGYGIAISYSLILIPFIFYLCFSRKIASYHLFENWQEVKLKLLIELIKVGIPIGIAWVTEVIFFAIIAILMGVISVTTLAAYQISYQYLMIVLSILFALDQSTAMRIGNEIACNKCNKMKIIYVANVLIGIGISLIFSIFYIKFPDVAIGLDISVSSKQLKDVTIEAARFFPIVAVLLLTDSLRMIGSGALRGLKDTKMQMIITSIGLWAISLPICYLLAFKFQWGGVGLWWGMVIGFFITSLMISIRFNQIVNKIN